MKRIEIKRREIDDKKLRFTEVPRPPDDAIFIQETPTQLVCNGEVVAGYYKLKQDSRFIAKALKTIKYAKTERTGGLPTKSRIFGCSPRITIRKDFCSKCELSYENPETSDLLQRLAFDCEDAYKNANPQIYAEHRKKIETIKPEWRMKGTVFTQGIVNWNNQLRFHKDQGNFKETWNAMLSFKKDIRGGFLYLPEFNVSFACDDGTISVFDGQAILHGVTPIKRLSNNSYRYTIVYYSLKQMTKCLTMKEELTRIKKIKTEREKRRV